MRELYQQLIIDHGRKPRNFGVLAAANHVQNGYNPLCGDKLTIYLIERQGIIEDIKFDGSGCAISVASASLMTQAIKGKTIQAALALFNDFHQVVVEGAEEPLARLGKLAVLSGVAEYPARVKCATLCWHTLLATLKGSTVVVSTE